MKSSFSTILLAAQLLMGIYPSFAEDQANLKKPIINCKTGRFSGDSLPGPGDSFGPLTSDLHLFDLDLTQYGPESNWLFSGKFKYIPANPNDQGCDIPGDNCGGGVGVYEAMLTVVHHSKTHIDLLVYLPTHMDYSEWPVLSIGLCNGEESIQGRAINRHFADSFWAQCSVEDIRGLNKLLGINCP